MSESLTVPIKFITLHSIQGSGAPGKKNRHILGLPDVVLFPRTLTIDVNPANIRSYEE
jgi:hypothetical protein